MAVWVLRDPAEVPLEEPALARERGGIQAEQFNLEIGGLDGVGHLRWGKRSLAVGDEIAFRILPPGEFTEGERFDPFPSDIDA